MTGNRFFKRKIQAARNPRVGWGACDSHGGKILSIHSRGAASNVLESLKNSQSSKAVLHWFSGSIKELQLAIEMNCWFSVGLPMMKSEKGKNIVKKIPVDRLLTESDGPFVNKAKNTPIKPTDMDLIEEKLCKVWGVSTEGVKSQLRSNLKALVS